MTHQCPVRLFGFMIATAINYGAKRGWKLEWFTRHQGAATVMMQFLDRHRFELSDAGGTAPARLTAETKTVAGTSTRCALFRRAEEVLGSGPWQRSTCEFWLPETVVSPADYYGIHYIPAGVKTDAGKRAGHRAPESVYLEFHRNRLPWGQPGKRVLFFTLTQQQANERIEQIAEQYDFFERDDEASTDALTNLMFAILSGGDIPPLTDWQENDDEEADSEDDDHRDDDDEDDDEAGDKRKRA